MAKREESPVLIGQSLTYNARNNPRGEALIFGDRRLSWSELNTAANRVANGLLALGAEHGDRVVLLLGNSVEFVESFYALAKIGCISAPVMPRSVGSEVAYVANDLGAKFIIVGEASTALVGDTGKDLGSIAEIIGVGDGHGLRRDYRKLKEAASPAEPDAGVEPDHALTVKYTSGTTGAPKGCVRTHRQFAMAAAVALFEQPVFDTDITLITSPLAAGMALSELTKYIVRGTPIVLLPRADPEAILEAIERERVSIGYAMETSFARMCMHPNLDQADFSSLRLFGGGRPRDALQRLRAQKTFTAGFTGGFGSSEAGGRVSFKKPEDYELALSDGQYEYRLASLGREARLFRIECLDGDNAPLPAGEVGELAIQGPSVFKEYWRRPEETAKAFRHGWLMTGDLASKDEGGHLYLRGRKTDMIKTGGVSVYPAEIEPVLTAHEMIAEAAVVGIPDREWGEKVIACVVAKGACTEAQLIDFCRDKLAGHKRPKAVRFLHALPVNEVGKVLKKDLREMLIKESEE